MNKPNVVKRLNRHVTNPESKQIDLSGQAPNGTEEGDISISQMSTRQISAAVRDTMTYFTSLDGL